MIARSLVACASIVLAAVATGSTATPSFATVVSDRSFAVAASTDDAECQAFQSWFARQPGSRLVASATQNFDRKYAPTRKRDNILNYSPPNLNDDTTWYRAMKHYRTTVGSTRCASAFYDPTSKTVLVLSEGGTQTNLTITTLVSNPSGLPIHAVPNGTQNGVRLGMTLAQVRAIDGQGTLQTDGRYQSLWYSQNIRKAPGAEVINYVSFLFDRGKVVAANAGGGV